MSLKDYLKGIATTGISRALHRLEEDVHAIVNKTAQRVSAYIARQLMSTMLIGVSVVFLALAGIFCLMEYFYLTKTISFLFGGLLMLIIGLLLKIKR